MLFNSLDFAIFLPLVFLIYWYLTNESLKIQNAFIVVSSYIFYGWWDWRFLFLIIFSTLVDFTIGRLLRTKSNRSTRKALLCLSILINLGFLGFFKYYNFFLESFTDSFSFLGFQIRGGSLNIILPVGISFYTFQTLSYTIDVYRNKLKATNSIIQFSAFVSFFPQLVAGPIERATNLLPQFSSKRHFNPNQAIDGTKQMLWGFFKKIVIADSAAVFANEIFNNSENYSGSTLVIGAIFFAFQIYGDFSGYSDIAIGTSKLFGFRLNQNFAYPYFSRDIAEFWRRWHISLSTWFRDYLYIPLGGSKGGTLMRIRNTFAIFIVSGFWHGANWTFIVWGAINAFFFLPLLLQNKNRRYTDVVAAGKILPSLLELFQMMKTFILITLAWIFFRADNLSHAIDYLSTIFSSSLLSVPDFSGRSNALISILFIIVFLLIEWRGRNQLYAIESVNYHKSIRYTFYYVIVLCILWFWGNEQQFIYFQF